MAEEKKKQHVIMTMPLPDWMSYIEDLVSKAEAAGKNADRAAAEARAAGESAAEEATATARKLVTEMQQSYEAKIKELEGRLAEHDTRLYTSGAALQGPPKK